MKITTISSVETSWGKPVTEILHMNHMTRKLLTMQGIEITLDNDMR